MKEEEADTKPKFSARVDFVLELPTHLVILEMDERQHHETKNPFGYSVSCELSRMSKTMGVDNDEVPAY